MNEDEVKAAVERIAALEQMHDDLVSAEDGHHRAAACLHMWGSIEKSLEQYGYVLGDQGDDIIVYPLGWCKQAHEARLMYNRSSKTWRTVSTTTLPA